MQNNVAEAQEAEISAPLSFQEAARILAEYAERVTSKKSKLKNAALVVLREAERQKGPSL